MRLARILLLLALAGPAWGEVSTNATYDELLYAATRYGNTEARRAEKVEARAELFRRGPDSLREIMDRLPVDNVMLQVLAMELVSEHVPAEAGTPLLMGYLENEKAETRRMAAYFLGFYPAALHREALLKLLEDDTTRNAALRTLGKWKVGRGRPAMVKALRESDQERTRVLAANALREVGNDDDLPALIAALGDPVFTVRNAAARGVASFGWEAHGPLLKALDQTEGAARRQVVRLLGELQVKAAIRPLRRLLEQEDAGLRADAARALRQLGESGAARWLRGPPVERVEGGLLLVAP